MSYQAQKDLTLAELNEKHRALRRPVPPSTLPQPGQWQGSGEPISAKPAGSHSIAENGERAKTQRFRIHHPPIPMPR